MGRGGAPLFALTNPLSRNDGERPYLGHGTWPCLAWSGLSLVGVVGTEDRVWFSGLRGHWPKQADSGLEAGEQDFPGADLPPAWLSQP